MSKPRNNVIFSQDLFVVLAIFLSIGQGVVSAKPESKLIDSCARDLAKQLLKNAGQKQESVAVMPFENVQGKATQLGQLVSESLSQEIVRSGKLKVVERAQIEKIYQELKLSLTGAIGQTTAQEIGKMSGAAYLVIGTTQKIGNEIQIFAKLVQTETAEIGQVGSSAVKADEALLAMNRPLHPDGNKEEPAAVLSKKGIGGCIWVESSGVVDFSEKETKHQLRAKAIVSARQKAVSAILGNDASPEFSGFGVEAFRKDSKLIENALLLTRYARIEEEKIVEEGAVDGADCKGCKYRVLIQACVAPPHKNFDNGFQVQLNLNRSQFIEGDEAQAIVNATRDSYVYLFSVDADWNAILVFPNAAAKENQVHADGSLVYPDDAHKKSGIHLVAELPKDADASAETLRVIAVPQPLKESDLNGTYMQIVQKLNIRETDWVEDAQSFTITKGIKKAKLDSK